jgi:hypothetical protein
MSAALVVLSCAGVSQAERWWTVGTPVGGEMAVRDVKAGEQVVFTAGIQDLDAFGVDRFPCPFSMADQPDELRYQWSKSAREGGDSGSWIGVTSNRSVIWRVPSRAGKVKISLRVDDLPLAMTSNKGQAKGTRDDDPITKERWVSVALDEMNGPGTGLVEQEEIITASPERLDLVAAADAAAVEGKVALERSMGKGALRLRKAAFSPPVAGLRIASMAETENGCRVGIVFDGASAEDAATTLMLEPVDPDLEQVNVPVTIRAAARSTVTPASVFFGICAPGEAITKTATVLTRASDGITGLVLPNDAGSDGLSVELQRNEDNPLQYAVSITWIPNGDATELRREVCINALRGETMAERIKIPCLGLVKRE